MVSTAAILLLAGAQVVFGASLVQISGFSPNPTNITAYAYVPANVQSNPALLVGIHCCTCDAAYAASFFTSYADTYGFVGVFPQTNRDGKCWDVGTTASHTRDGASDPTGIAAITKFAISTYNVDPKRVHVAGISSGAFMTNVMAALYPDLFVGAGAYMGVPFNCWQSTASPSATASAPWDSTCAGGLRILSADTWGGYVRSAYPSYTGSRPRMQLWHGTADAIINYNNLGEETKQWTNVLNTVSSTVDTPQTNYTRTRYSDSAGVVQVETYSIAGVGHVLPLSGQVAYFVDYFPLLKSAATSATTGATATATTSPTVTTTTASASPTSCSAHWGQCGGLYWTGPTCCASGYTCTYSNAYYSQCL